MDNGARIETLTKLAVKQHATGSWIVTYDGVFLGDDRKFSTQALAERELEKRLQKDARDAITYARPLLYVREGA